MFFAQTNTIELVKNKGSKHSSDDLVLLYRDLTQADYLDVLVNIFMERWDRFRFKSRLV